MQKLTETQTRPGNWLLRMLSYLRDGIILERARLRWHYFKLDHRRDWWTEQKKSRTSFLYTLQPGVRMRLFFDSEIAWLVYVKNFEWKERQFHNTFLQTGDTYMDIGANIGLFTLIAARRVGLAGKVFSFEPSSTTFQRLLTNVKLNRFTNVFAHQVAISDKSGQADMTVSLDGYDGRNSLAAPTGGEKFGTESVSTISLDQFVQEHKLKGHITMIKIDVEGWETHVLDGGQATLSGPDAPVLQVEFTEDTQEEAGCSTDELYRALVGLGYQLYSIDAKTRDLTPVSQEQVQNRHLNVIATKDIGKVLARIRAK